MRLIDADEVIKRTVRFEEMTGVRLDLVHDLVSSAPTVETAVISSDMIVQHDILEYPWCEQYVMDKMASDIAYELLKHIEFRSFDDDPHLMAKRFRARLVIVKDAKKDEVEE